MLTEFIAFDRTSNLESMTGLGVCRDQGVVGAVMMGVLR